jgi:hypothetical protein
MSGMTLGIILALTILQWLAFMLISFASRSKAAAKGMHSSERNLLFSTVVLAAAWIATFGMTQSPSPAAKSGSEASMVSGEKRTYGSCASIEAGMPASVVQARVGKPDETRDDAATRGPGASILIYRDSRCAVHLLDGRVEFVD